MNLSWNATESVAPVTSVEIARTPGFTRLRQVRCTEALRLLQRHERAERGALQVHDQGTDQAGNETVRTITVTPGPRLFGPSNGARLTTPPALRWTPIRHATYYNVQLYRGDRKVLSMWPSHAKLQLKQSWHFGGHLWRLKPGTYRWYVWPGYGRRSSAKYGSMVGKGRFVMEAANAAVAAYTAYPNLGTLVPDASR